VRKRLSLRGRMVMTAVVAAGVALAVLLLLVGPMLDRRARDQAFASLRAPIVRVAGANTVIPFNLALEKAMVPQVADIVAGVRSVLG